ncbi:hypothetical protein ACLI4Q_06140 [Natrialbaceae archaeon A-CW1-1]
MNRVEIDNLISILQRSSVLAAYDQGPASRAVIADRAGCSRATVYRAERFLETHGLLENSPIGYEITGVGRTILAQTGRFQAVIEGAINTQALLSHTDAVELTDLLHLLADAELVEDDPAIPYHIEHRLHSVVAESDEHIQVMSRSLGPPRIIDEMRERVHDGVSFEWIVPTKRIDEFTTVESNLLTQENASLYHLGEVSVDLAIFDETLVVIGFDEHRGVVAVVAMTDEQEAVAWGKKLIATYRSEAEPVTVVKD